MGLNIERSCGHEDAVLSREGVRGYPSGFARHRAGSLEERQKAPGEERPIAGKGERVPFVGRDLGHAAREL
jgi:hypothetical protein